MRGDPDARSPPLVFPYVPSLVRFARGAPIARSSLPRAPHPATYPPLSEEVRIRLANMRVLSMKPYAGGKAENRNKEQRRKKQAT